MTMNAIEAAPDTFYWLGEINKASAVMVVEQSIVPAALGATIAKTIAKVIAAGNQPHAARPGDYLLLEATLIEAGGPRCDARAFRSQPSGHRRHAGLLVFA